MPECCLTSASLARPTQTLPISSFSAVARACYLLHALLQMRMSGRWTGKGTNVAALHAIPAKLADLVSHDLAFLGGSLGRQI